MHPSEKRLVAWSFVLMCLISGLLSEKDCVYKFRSGDARVGKRGTFQSPAWPDKYPDNLRCKYIFEAKPKERVKLNFTSFHLQGLPPTCSNDYVDVYAQVKKNDDLLEVPLPQRFCGEMLQNLVSAIISRYDYLVFTFYTDDIRTLQGFQGVYQFIDSAPYDILPGSTSVDKCEYTIRSEDRKSGYIISPTYPGMYADQLHCFYKLEGKPGQRIQLHFIDFDLFDGGDYCPYDYLKIFDGHINQAEVMGLFCSVYEDLILYSTSEALHIEFVTKSGRQHFNKNILENQGDYSFSRRGFNITYEFRENFVDLDFIQDDAKHISGTECDQRIMSTGESNGSLFSPSYPNQFPINVTCHYYLDGLMDRENLEKARITFEDFDIPGSMPYCTLGYISANLDGQVEKRVSGEKFCGGLLPPPLTSTDPRMVLIFSTSNGVLGRGFNASYSFITDYGISDGEQIKEGMCQFKFESKKRKTGIFNSPRYPSNYRTNIDCTYVFIPINRERIRISFDTFKLTDGAKLLDGDCDNNDYVDIYEYRGKDTKRTKLGQYCRGVTPGPVLSSDNVSKMELLFHSDDQHVAMGFKALYEFVSSGQLETQCGESIKSDGTGGTITSPNYPSRYKASTYCQWTITASRKENKILLQFPQIALEGVKDEGCHKAALRIYSVPVQELCGTIEAHSSLESQQDSVTLTLTTSKTATGGEGFKITWTEVYGNAENVAQCYGFMCESRGYCIDANLKCNGVANCGTGDNSDESTDCPSTSRMQALHIAIGTSISGFFLIIFIVCGVYHRRRFRERKPDKRDNVEVRYVSPSTGSSTTDRLLSIESPRCQKVSIV